MRRPSPRTHPGPPIPRVRPPEWLPRPQARATAGQLVGIGVAAPITIPPSLGTVSHRTGGDRVQVQLRRLGADGGAPDPTRPGPGCRCPVLSLPGVIPFWTQYSAVAFDNCLFQSR